jgi:sodium/hydrogen antiporter
MTLVELTEFNLATGAIGGFTFILCLVSYFIKERLYVAEPVPAVLFGFVFQKANWIIPEAYGQIPAISKDLARLVLGVQLVIVGVQLPVKYLKKTWFSIMMLLVGVMSVMWIVSALVIFLIIPNLTFVESLIIGACITPTDPVLCNSLVHGKFSERYIAPRLRSLILAESGANDGFGYPFLFLALSIYRYSGAGQVIKQWVVYTILYQILLGVAYGAVVGFVAQEVLRYCHKYDLVDKEPYVLSVAALAVFIIGTAGLIGTDDLLACFIAGNTFTWNDEYRLETEDDTLQPILDFALNLGIFLWIGATVPWEAYHDLLPTWRFFVFGLCILVFRRVPACLALYKLIPEIDNIEEALFAGFFAPMGVGSLFYLEVCLETLQADGIPDNTWLIQVIAPIIYFAILCSVVVHGFSVPVLRLVIKIVQKFGWYKDSHRRVMIPLTTSFGSSAQSGQEQNVELSSATAVNPERECGGGPLSRPVFARETIRET